MAYLKVELDLESDLETIPFFETIESETFEVSETLSGIFLVGTSALGPQLDQIFASGEPIFGFIWYYPGKQEGVAHSLDLLLSGSAKANYIEISDSRTIAAGAAVSVQSRIHIAQFAVLNDFNASNDVSLTALKTTFAEYFFAA